MRNIFLFLIFAVVGVLVGWFLEKMARGIINFIKKRSIRARILRENKRFFEQYTDNQGNQAVREIKLKENIKEELNKKRGLFSFRKKPEVKGGDKDGDSIRSNNSREQISNTGIPATNTSSANSTTNPQSSNITNASENRGQGRSGQGINRNLFKKGRKLD